jgi:PBSX family phage terminase large subunit
VIIFTEKQKELLKALKGNEQVLMYGGSRSGKTFCGVSITVLRALACPESSHIILRQTATSARFTIFNKTLPTVLKKISTGLWKPKIANKQYMTISLPNGSEIFVGGADDEEGMEKWLGSHFSTVMMDECSNILFAAYSLFVTRMSEKNKLKKLMLFSENPTDRHHWSHKIFIEHVHPITKESVEAGGKFSIQMNPKDNVENIGTDYIKSLERNLRGNDRARFLDGNFTDTVEGAVYGSELSQARKENRISDDIKEQEGYPIKAVFDIGVSDATAIWTTQYIEDKIYFLDYCENSNESMKYYINYLLSSEFKYCQLIVPHDVEHRWWGSDNTIYDMLYAACDKNGWTLLVLPKLAIADGINAVKSLSEKMYFHKTRCEKGLEAVGSYKHNFNEALNVAMPAPIHNWASHAADALRYACLAQTFTSKAAAKLTTTQLLNRKPMIFSGETTYLFPELKGFDEAQKKAGKGRNDWWN